MRWFRVRKAENISSELRRSFEQYGKPVMQQILASEGRFRVAGSLTNVSSVENELLSWLTEEHDKEDRKETWLLTMEVAITVFVLAEVLLSLLGSPLGSRTIIQVSQLHSPGAAWYAITAFR